MTVGAWFMVIFGCLVLAAIYCAWEERRFDRKYRADFREELAQEAERLRGGAR